MSQKLCTGVQKAKEDLHVLNFGHTLCRVKPKVFLMNKPYILLNLSSELAEVTNHEESEDFPEIYIKIII